MAIKINVDKEDLEKSIDKKDSEKDINLSKPEEIAFHKGCLNTLVGERNELIKMISNVEAIIQAHIKRLQELGVKIETGEKK